MNKTGNKKQKLLLVILGIASLVVVIYLTLIQFLHGSIQNAVEKIENTKAKLSINIKKVQQTDQIQAVLESTTANLDLAEKGIPKGDVYFWMLRNVEKFQTTADIIFNQIEPPRLIDSENLPKAPYTTALFTLSGRARYHDFGGFLANFENTFPYSQLRSLTLERAGFDRAGNSDKDMLQFSLEFSTLVKTNSTRL